MITLVYAGSRRPCTSRAEFTARWRQHGAFALSHDSFRQPLQRYAHHDPLENPTDFPGASDDYDALGTISAVGASSLEAMLGSPDMAGPIRDDGASTFARTRTINTTVEERYLRTNATAPVSVSVFLAGHLEADEQTKRITAINVDLLDRLEPFGRLVRRAAISPAISPAALWGTYVELGFDDRTSAAVGYDGYLAALAEASREWVLRSLVIVSTRHLLYES